MKKAVAIITLNGLPLLRYALQSVYAWADIIKVVDGGPDGPSKDETFDVVSEIDKDLKIEYTKGVFGCHERHENWDLVQRNVYMEMLEKDNPDWVLVVDSDEVYKRNDLNILNGIIIEVTRGGVYQSITYPFVYFIGDFNHITEAAIPSRLFRWHPGMRHTDIGVEPKTVEGVNVFKAATFTNRVRVYHYGHALSVKHEGINVAKYLQRDEFIIPKDDMSNLVEYSEKRASNWLMTTKKEVFKGEHPKVISDFVKRAEGLRDSNGDLDVEHIR